MKVLVDIYFLTERGSHRLKAFSGNENSVYPLEAAQEMPAYTARQVTNGGFP